MIYSEATEPFAVLRVPGGKLVGDRLFWWAARLGTHAAVVGRVVESGRAEEEGIRACGQEGIPQIKENRDFGIPEQPPIEAPGPWGIAFGPDTGEGRSWLHVRDDGSSFASGRRGAASWPTEGAARAFLAAHPAAFGAVERMGRSSTVQAPAVAGKPGQGAFAFAS